MPPIFGIIQTGTQKGTTSSRVSWMSQLSHASKNAATYMVPRNTETLTTDTAFFSAAVLKNGSTLTGLRRCQDDLQKRPEAIIQKGPLTIVADAALYKKPNDSTPDIEVIYDAWLKWGNDCVNYLYGDFAFVVFNQETGSIYCARDQFGVRPLYYTVHEELFIFGSEIRLIVQALPIKPEIRHDYLLDTLMTIKNPKNLTPYPDIFRLEPAHSMSLAGETISKRCYWKPDPGRKITFKTENDYIALFREKLIQAVQARSNSSRPGAELSGGLDSSAITGIAAFFGQKPVAFSNVFPSGTDINFKDEQEFMRKMVTFAGSEWIPVERHSASIINILKHTLSIHGTYIQQNFNVFSRSLYEKAAEKNICVLLSGFGGDELVSARISIPWIQYIDERQWKIILDELYYKGTDIRSLMKPLLLAARYVKTKIRTEKYSSGVFTKELLDHRFANLPLNAEFAAKNNLRQKLGENFRWLRKNTMAERQAARIMMDHLPQRLEYCYTAAAQYGIEYRYPLLDVDLVETALAFPPWVKQHHGINRYLFREAIRGFVPEEIRTRNDKSGSTIPQTLYSLVNEKDEILDVFSQARGSDFLKEIFDFSKFPGWYDKLSKRDAADMNYLMPGAFYDYLMILLYYDN